MNRKLIAELPCRRFFHETRGMIRRLKSARRKQRLIRDPRRSRSGLRPYHRVDSNGEMA